MLDFDGFQQAIKLDFTDFPENGSEFERMVQELLQTMGLHAERVGLGPDQGADIIAEEVIFDRLGTKQVRRYVVQCKHFAHSGKAVGRSDVTEIRDTIEHHEANGYVLVTSTDVTTSLKQRIQQIRSTQPSWSIQIWDRTTLEQRLATHPVLIAKYFPKRLRRVKIVIPEPKGEKEIFVRDRILSHQREYVGLKFIPKLYVNRHIEEPLHESLRAPIQILKELKSNYPKLIRRYIRQVNHQFSIPQFLIVVNDPPVALTWTTDLQKLNNSVKQAGERLLSHQWNPVSSYMTDGIRGVWRDFDGLVQKHKAYVRSIQSVLDPFIEFVMQTEESVPKRNDDDPQKEESKKFRRRWRATRKSKDEISKIVPWLSDAFLRAHNLSSLYEKPSENVLSLPVFKKNLLQLYTDLKANPLAYLKDELERIQNACQVVVDIAGSGKTNLCCRLALQLVNKAFVIFLTGKAFGKDFSNVVQHIEAEIREALHLSSEMDLKRLSRWLQETGYPLVIIFDGVNENASPAQMRKNLKSLYNVVVNSPTRALITSRVEYWNYYSDIFTRDGFSRITGGKLAKFTEDEHETAIPVYLDHYKIDVRLESRAWEQLKRPLILRFFCEAYGNPKRRAFRHIPPIKEVRLFRLFGEYCRVKYGNICESLKADGYFVTEKEIEEVSYLIAELCLQKKRRALAAEVLMTSIQKRSIHGAHVYRALLDEDIVIEETLEIKGHKLERTTSFVYEAFMEYLMAKVLLFNCDNEDTKLSSQVKNLLEADSEFVHVRGILAFLMPECVDRFPKTRELILVQLRRPEYAENCVPVLLNLWDSDWELGIWPVLQAAAENLLMVPLEQLAIFIEDWVSEHHAGSFFRCIQTDPQTAISILDTHIIKIVRGASHSNQQVIIKSLLSLLRSARTSMFAQEVLFAIRHDVDPSSDMVRDDKRLFPELVAASLPVLDEIRHSSRDSRDWIVLDLLAKIGEHWRIDIEDIPSSERLFLAARNAVFDGLFTGKRISDERRWWADRLGLNVSSIEAEVEDWVRDPLYDPEMARKFRSYFEFDFTRTDD